MTGKVYTTNVSDVEYVEFEHFPKKVEHISLENKIESYKNKSDKILKISNIPRNSKMSRLN